MNTETKEPTLEERIRAAGRHTRGDSVTDLRIKINKIRHLEAEARRQGPIGVMNSILIESTCGWLQHAILRRLEEDKP